MSSYFERLDATRFRPLHDAGGAWNNAEIHFSPLGGLVAHAMDLHRAARGDNPSMSLARLSFDILGFLAAEVCEVEVETVRPGRTIELVQATVVIAGRPVVLARGWYAIDSDTRAIAGGETATLAVPDERHRFSIADTWPGGYVASLEMRALEAPRPGRATAWLRTELDIVGGEQASHHASFIALVDTANGVAVRQSPNEWMFPNLDLTIHLHTQPTGRWVGLDTTVTFGPTGQGLTSTELHDERGPVGRAEQTLTVRPIR
ncbi:thioesterase [Leifsonia sp. Root227]|uniref:thioesterase family protein n=1 Tax=Leifsonia sp. Root227 TaxID=1736496 RepID=UPI0006F47276|nr:thioesterase family protein [Leifsonia sp. Root227]KRC50695.1 thioesterase [Leifsonia sp. Root227]